MPRSSETQTEEFRKINRSGKIPALQDGDFVLSESAAINTYLCEKCESALVPLAGTKERARYDQWCFWCMTELGTMHFCFCVSRWQAFHLLWLTQITTPTFFDSVQHKRTKKDTKFIPVCRNVLYPYHLHFTIDTTLSSAIYRKIADADADPAALANIEAAAAYFIKQLATAVAELQMTGAYILGEEFSAADILFTSCLDWAERIGWLPSRADEASMGVLDAYARRVRGRKAYTEAVEMTSR